MGKTAQAGPAPEQDTADMSGDADGVDLEAGIASIFAAIRSGGDADGERAAGEVPEDSGATYDLLARLDQLWQGAGSGEA
ncbi:hypothetical protein [Devosia sp.]|uniref:hypothetical protein n=1 Tax=Devosia sp. TaxID=1871048 RepID=UPI002EFB7D22